MQPEELETRLRALEGSRAEKAGERLMISTLSTGAGDDGWAVPPPISAVGLEYGYLQRSFFEMKKEMRCPVPSAFGPKDPVCAT